MTAHERRNQRPLTLYSDRIIVGCLTGEGRRAASMWGLLGLVFVVRY